MAFQSRLTESQGLITFNLISIRLSDLEGGLESLSKTSKSSKAQHREGESSAASVELADCIGYRSDTACGVCVRFLTYNIYETGYLTQGPLPSWQSGNESPS